MPRRKPIKAPIPTDFQGFARTNSSVALAAELALANSAASSVASLALADFMDSSALARAFEPGMLEMWLARIDKSLQGRRVAEIVDLGCGTGAAQPLLKQRFPQAQYLGLDASLPMLSAAQAKLGLAPGRLRLPSWLGGSSRAHPQLVAADASALPLSQGSCGLLWSNLLLHWLDDPLPALKEKASS